MRTSTRFGLFAGLLAGIAGASAGGNFGGYHRFAAGSYNVGVSTKRTGAKRKHPCGKRRR